MLKTIWSTLILALIAGNACAQDYLGAGSVGISEPLFEYDDPEPWKHGYLKIMPYYGGHHSGLPYNYHDVFSQTQTAVGWGMPHGMPYSQQWWHRYEAMADPGRAATEPGGYYGNVVPAQSPAMQQFAGPRLQPSSHPVGYTQAAPTYGGPQLAPVGYQQSVGYQQPIIIPGSSTGQLIR